MADLQRPLGGSAAKNPTHEELQREGADFVAFAQMFGGSGKLAAATASNGEEG